MGEFIQRDPSDAKYVPDSKGAGSDVGKMLQAVSLAAQFGKSVEEVLAFMGQSTDSSAGLPQAVTPQVPQVLKDITIPLPVEDDTVLPDAKVVAPKEVEADDKFIITEIVDVTEASEADLAKLSELEENNNWDDKIRVGSTVRVVYQPQATKINWVGKKGKVTRVIGNEAAKVYEVEFSGRKIAHIQLNKKTGKLEKGFKNKSLKTTFSEDAVELV